MGSSTNMFFREFARSLDQGDIAWRDGLSPSQTAQVRWLFTNGQDVTKVLVWDGDRLYEWVTVLTEDGLLLEVANHQVSRLIPHEAGQEVTLGEAVALARLHFFGRPAPVQAVLTQPRAGFLCVTLYDLENL